MATVVLLHSALGLTPHVRAWAEALRADDHVVVTPDLFGGDTYADVDAGVDRVDSAGGPPAFVATAAAQIAHLDGPVVFAGFSLGAAVAEVMALTRADAAGLVLMHSAMAPSWFDVDSWPDGLTAQLHYARDDPWMEPDETAALLAIAGDACEVHEYPGDGHLFGFEGWHEYDDDASHRMFERVTEFLADLDAGPSSRLRA